MDLALARFGRMGSPTTAEKRRLPWLGRYSAKQTSSSCS